jgi:anthranilate synthase/aminodeoxychorismate synthase-like glutamine amidotransferase
MSYNVLIIDNFDSFTYNLYHLAGKQLQKLDQNFNITVKRNNEISVRDIENQKFNRIIISPGPGNCENIDYFGVCRMVIRDLGQTIPIFGICLGMQGIASVFGGKIDFAVNKMHGKTSNINHDNKGVLYNIPQSVEVMRYHSQVVDKNSFPDCLVITAMSQDDEEIMGLRHRDFPIEGVQFHPESYMTTGGRQMMFNFLKQ